MKTITSRRSLLTNSAATVAALGLGGKLVRAQEAPIRIGVIYERSGPFAAAGSVPCAIGAQIAIDIVNERGGVAGKYKIQPINADSQSKADAAINEVERLINQEDGPYGVGVAQATEQFAKERGLQIVLREGYSASAPDLSSLVTKLKRAGADVISHCGYNPDITLFLRQGREAGLRFRMLVGNGAGYSQLDKLRATFGKDVDNFCNIDPVPAQLLNPASLAPGLGDLTKMMVERYKTKTNATDVPPHCSMGFNQTWILLNNVLPIANEKYGGFDAEAVRKAALDVDIPPGGTIQGYGVKFYPPGTQLSGQNERSTPVVMQNAGEHITVVWPANIKTQEPVLPLPASSIYAMR